MSNKTATADKLKKTFRLTAEQQKQLDKVCDALKVATEQKAFDYMLEWFLQVRATRDEWRSKAEATADELQGTKRTVRRYINSLDEIRAI